MVIWVCMCIVSIGVRKSRCWLFMELKNADGYFARYRAKRLEIDILRRIKR